MISSSETPIAQSWFVQVTPQRYRINTESDYYDYNLLQKININTVNLLNFSINNQFPNISKFYNQFQINVQGDNYLITMPASSYNFWDIVNLQSQIVTQLNAQTPYTWSMTLGGNSNKFTILTCTSGQNFNLVYNFLRPELNQIFRYLGFSDSSEPSFNTQATSQQSKYGYNVQVTSNIQFQVKNCGNVFSEVIGVIAQIPLDVAVQTNVVWQSQFYQQARHVIDKVHKYPISSLQIGLLDDLGNPLQLSGQPMSATLLFEEYQMKM